MDTCVSNQKLDEPTIIGLFMSLMLGGHHTTAAGLSTFILQLARDQALQDTLRADPSRIPDAIEESLRLHAPQQAMARRCTGGGEIAGRPLRTETISSCIGARRTWIQHAGLSRSASIWSGRTNAISPLAEAFTNV